MKVAFELSCHAECPPRLKDSSLYDANYTCVYIQGEDDKKNHDDVAHVMRSYWNKAAKLNPASVDVYGTAPALAWFEMGMTLQMSRCAVNVHQLTGTDKEETLFSDVFGHSKLEPRATPHLKRSPITGNATARNLDNRFLFICFDNKRQVTPCHYRLLEESFKNTVYLFEKVHPAGTNKKLHPTAETLREIREELREILNTSYCRNLYIALDCDSVIALLCGGMLNDQKFAKIELVDYCPGFVKVHTH